MWIHLISKLRWDAALCFRGMARVISANMEAGDYAHIPEQYLTSTTVKDGFQTCTYQAQLLHEDFLLCHSMWLSSSKRTLSPSLGHFILFSSDLELSCENLVDYYSLRFQIEFNFRDANSLGFRGFHECQPDCCDQCRQLILFMVNLSQLLMWRFSTNDPDFGCWTSNLITRVRYALRC